MVNYGWHSKVILESKKIEGGGGYPFSELLIFEYAYPAACGYFIAADIRFR